MTAVISPARFDAAIFDLDGVITDTASVHAAAWRELFDGYLTARPVSGDEDHSPFTENDYLRYVDGKPRADGVTSFLAARGISVPARTAAELGRRKDHRFLALLRARGVRAFDSTVALIRDLQAAGLGTAVFSASRNCRHVLRAAGLGDLFDVRVDGIVAAELGLPGKPQPAMLLEAARRLDAAPGRCVVVEDSEAGVTAGRAGGFGLVLGVDRTGHGGQLIASGADLIVTDLSEVMVA